MLKKTKSVIANDRLVNIMENTIQHYQKFLEHLRYNGDRQGDAVWLLNRDEDRYGYWSNRRVVSIITALTTAFSYVIDQRYTTPLATAFSYVTDQRYTTPLLLDAGCGAGNILLLARIIGFDSIGIEIDKKTARIGRKLLKSSSLSRITIMHKDLATYKQYNIYDVVYYYQPMYPRSNPMEEFLKLLSNGAKIGALIIVDGNDPFENNEHFKLITHKEHLIPIYEKLS